MPRFALGAALHPSFYHRNAKETTAAAAVAAVPGGVTVEAVNHLGPHLSGRDTVLLWDGDGEDPAVPAVGGRGRETGGSSPSTPSSSRNNESALLREHGYQTVFERGGYIVLHSPDAGTPGR